jgi:uncharacterized repeat protein (TIGR01451 family)
MKLNMKRKQMAFGAVMVAAMAVVPMQGSLLAQVMGAGSALAQAVNKQPKVDFKLSVAKLTTAKNDQGATVEKWQPLDSGNAVVAPGDTLRYNVAGKNTGNDTAKKLVITQPIPQKTVYVLNSATVEQQAVITYSIDGGKSYVAKPTVRVQLASGEIAVGLGPTEGYRPAPPEAYTHVRWQVSQSLSPQQQLLAQYQVRVK